MTWTLLSHILACWAKYYTTLPLKPYICLCLYTLSFNEKSRALVQLEGTHGVTLNISLCVLELPHPWNLAAFVHKSILSKIWILAVFPIALVLFWFQNINSIAAPSIVPTRVSYHRFLACHFSSTSQRLHQPWRRHAVLWGELDLHFAARLQGILILLSWGQAGNFCWQLQTALKCTHVLPY